MAKATLAPKRKPAPKLPVAKKQRYRIDTNVIALEATLRSCNGILQEITDSPGRFKVGDVVADYTGRLVQIAEPYGQYHTQDFGLRDGYVCKEIEDDGARAFAAPSWLWTPSGSVRHIRAV